MTSKNTSIALGKPFTDFARRKVESGEFGSTSEVVREAMRRYIAEDSRREALDRALEEGLASPVVPFDIDEWFAEEFGAR
ncbi:MAG: antitoxin [Sphingomonadales bacterium 32-68-7]|nr:MAG: antitoxin [Sphingomonadales bacterium 12-68-11]OYX08508.1 MAG: antitoxin [Sphingomonadales bacterium 32-68-7]